MPERLQQLLATLNRMSRRFDDAIIDFRRYSIAMDPVDRNDLMDWLRRRQNATHNTADSETELKAFVTFTQLSDSSFSATPSPSSEDSGDSDLPPPPYPLHRELANLADNAGIPATLPAGYLRSGARRRL